MSKLGTKFSLLWIEIGFVWSTMSIGRRAVFDMKYSGVMRIMTKSIKCEKKREKKIRWALVMAKARLEADMTFWGYRNAGAFPSHPRGIVAKYLMFTLPFPCPCDCVKLPPCMPRWKRPTAGTLKHPPLRQVKKECQPFPIAITEEEVTQKTSTLDFVDHWVWG